MIADDELKWHEHNLYHAQQAIFICIFTRLLLGHASSVVATRHVSAVPPRRCRQFASSGLGCSTGCVRDDGEQGVCRQARLDSALLVAKTPQPNAHEHSIKDPKTRILHRCRNDDKAWFPF